MPKRKISARTEAATAARRREIAEAQAVEAAEPADALPPAVRPFDGGKMDADEPPAHAGRHALPASTLVHSLIQSGWLCTSQVWATARRSNAMWRAMWNMSRDFWLRDGAELHTSQSLELMSDTL